MIREHLEKSQVVTVGVGLLRIIATTSSGYTYDCRLVSFT